MSDPVRLARRVADLAHCTRAEAERYIKGGWVSVDGRVVEDPAQPVTTEVVSLDPEARAEAAEPATLLLHRPGAGEEKRAIDDSALVRSDTRWTEDPSGVRLLDRHFRRLTALMPLEAGASGMVVLSQDGRVWRRLTEDADTIEQEFVVEVSGDIAPWGMRRLNHGLRFEGRALPPCKVSWQNEVRLRFAIKGVRPGQLRDMCRQVGLEVVAIRRLRVGRVALAKMPAGAWRYLPVGERF